MSDPFRLDGRRILVTGASSDIGRAIALACASAGATIVATGRDTQRLGVTSGALGAAGANFVAVTADLTTDEGRESVVAAAEEVDGAVHAMAITGPMLLRQVNKDYLQSRFEANYFAPMLVTRMQLAKSAIRDDSALVFISSISAHAGTRGMSVYAATKASLVASAGCLALELAPKRIRVNCISPAIVRTTVYDTFGDQWLEEQAKRYPLGLGRPEDVAYAAQFLLSNAGRWVTGQALLLDGACAWV